MDDPKLNKLMQDDYSLSVQLPLTRHVALPVALPAGGRASL
jgi:hypothetical protein